MSDGTGVIAEPKTDRRGGRQYVSSRDARAAALLRGYQRRLADGVNIKELAEYLGRSNPGFTPRLYTHMLPSSHERAPFAPHHLLGGPDGGLCT